MSGKIVSNVNARIDYEIAKKSLADQGVIVPDGKLTQSYLRAETIFDQGRSLYEFPILVNSANAGTVTSNTCKLLNQQDAFYVTQMGYWVEVWVQDGAAPADLYKYVPITYPSIQFTDIGAISGFQGFKLWSGQISLIVNGDVILPGWDLKKHLKVPRTQREAYAGAWPNGVFYNVYDEFDGATDPFYPQEPNVVLLGNKGIKYQLEFPESIGNAIGASPTFEVRGVMYLRGLLAQNVSKMA